MRTAVSAVIVGMSIAGATAPASADPGCDTFGFLHPMCAGGAFDDGMSDSIPQPGLGAEGGPWGGAPVPNIDGGLSEPGAPGAI